MEMNLGASYTLAGNIDLTEANGSNPSGLWSSIGFSPIGDDYASSGPLAASFTGQLNGQGYAISNLTITVPSSQIGYVNYSGLFGLLDTSAVVKNLSLTNVAISGGYFSGALAARNAGQIVGVISSGHVWGQGAAAGGDIGGLVGFNFGSITNASSSANVASSLQLGATSYSNSIGGLVGSNYGTISNSYTNGQVVMGPNTYAGGFAGDNYGMITESYTTSSLLGQTGATPAGVGQFVANNSGAYNSGVLLYDYWLDYGFAGIGYNSGSSGGVSALTGAQSVQSASYGGFNFGPVWVAHDGVAQPTLLHATSGN